MHQLDAGRGAAVAHQLHDALQGRDHVVLPQADIAQGAGATPLHAGAFLEHQAAAACGQAAQVHQMPILHPAMAALVLPHRGGRDAVLEHDIAQLQLAEKLVLGFAVGHGAAAYFLTSGQADSDSGRKALSAGTVLMTL